MALFPHKILLGSKRELILEEYKIINNNVTVLYKVLLAGVDMSEFWKLNKVFTWE
jgi:hypothetical protein